jgi:excisionase family DNA binding protein
MSAATVIDVEKMPAMLTLRDAQNILGVSKQKMYEVAHSPGFPMMRLGRVIRVPRAAFLEWLDRKVGLETS